MGSVSVSSLAPSPCKGKRGAGSPLKVLTPPSRSPSPRPRKTLVRSSLAYDVGDGQSPCTPGGLVEPVVSGGTGVFLGGRYSKQEVITFGGISESSATGIRSSARIRAQPNADAQVMEWAQHKAYARDPGYNSGNIISPKFTIASIPTEVVIARASKLGVSLGKSPEQINSSVEFIKDLDLNRALTILERSSGHDLGEKDDMGSLVLQEAIVLSEDLQLEENKALEDHKDLTPRPVKTTRVGKKAAKNTSVVRRSDRLKTKKIK